MPSKSHASDFRIATFNASLNRSADHELALDLAAGNDQARRAAEVIQRVNPDIVLVNEFDFSPFEVGGRNAAEIFRDDYLGRSQNGVPAADCPYIYYAPSNTGVASGFDLNNNGQTVTTPGAPGYGDNALGFGAFEGQFGMVLFSKYPIDTANVRTFQNFLWKDMPGALLPDDPNTAAPKDWYSPQELEVVRLSSKSHWDVPVIVDGEVVHVLAAHPTPPVFDGPEDRNGRRNHDEIRLWADYVTPGKGEYLYDDQGGRGGLTAGAKFVIVGDYNADPLDGDSVDNAINQLLNNPLFDDSGKPASPGALEQSLLQGGVNALHTGDPRFDTADFADAAPNGPGNLRVDYVLPSKAGLNPVRSGVFWPSSSDPNFDRLVGTFSPPSPGQDGGGFPVSDHRLVYTDIDFAAY
jgi:3-phytase